MKIKNKLRLGFGFLFIVVLIFGLTSLLYINKLSESGRVVIKENYKSLTYTAEMRKVLDENSLPLSNEKLIVFKKALLQEEKNVTEPGELQAVNGLKEALETISGSANSTVHVRGELESRRYLRAIDSINMRAIAYKNEKANASVDKVTTLLALAGTFTFLVLFSFSVNFPHIISGPLNELLKGIRQVGQQNYNQRLQFTKDNEFAEVARAFNDMASKLNDWENSNLSKVTSEKLRIETIIEQMQDAIIGINEKQEIIFINSAAKRILNLTDNRLEGQLIADLKKNNDLLRFIDDEHKAGKPFTVVVDGKDSHFLLETREIIVPNLDKEPGPIKFASKSAGKVYVLKNITEFKERDDAKTNFIATISHELKTPISAIKMSLKLLNDERVGRLNPEQEQLSQHILDDTERLLKITSELLDLSQAETGNIQLNIVSTKPEIVLDYAVGAIAREAEQRGIAIKEQLSPDLPLVNLDVEKTAWVLINFLSNALRYSPSNSTIIVQISTTQGGKVEFSVRDFGKGIEAQYRTRLFDRYFQMPTDGQNKSGSGLGLAISKDFIEAQGGNIGLRSKVGEGSRFFFLLPAAKPLPS